MPTGAASEGMEALTFAQPNTVAATHSSACSRGISRRAVGTLKFVRHFHLLFVAHGAAAADAVGQETPSHKIFLVDPSQAARIDHFTSTLTILQDPLGRPPRALLHAKQVVPAVLVRVLATHQEATTMEAVFPRPSLIRVFNVDAYVPCFVLITHDRYRCHQLHLNENPNPTLRRPHQHLHALAEILILPLAVESSAATSDGKE